MKDFGKKSPINAFEAKSNAQKIAFAPMVFQATLTLRDLGILELLNSHRKQGLEPKSVAEELDLPLYGVKVLLEAGLGADVVYSEDEKYYLSKTGYFILTDKLTRVNMDFVADVCYQSMPKLKSSIVEERPVGLNVLGPWKTIYEGLNQLPEHIQNSWYEFDHFYSDSAFPDALPLVFEKNPTHIVDIGGNTGKWTAQCLNYNDKVHVTIVDLPGQLEQAERNLNNDAFSGRFSTLPIDLLADECEIPIQLDTVWMSQFLDCFSESQIVNILKRVSCSMAATSTLYVLEAFWDKQPHDAAAFSLVNTSLYFTCIANGNSKLYHSNEFKACAEQAGLTLVRENPDIGIGHTLLEYRLPA